MNVKEDRDRREKFYVVFNSISHRISMLHENEKDEIKQQFSIPNF
jgi:hypothetical protein